ncbi:MAG: adenylyltransferase/cytidyltransferase family protein [Alphaproteobacteria bacterium]|nr:adenylyltransferase/cytidyltransferase family protein [Alphaproteobacteria bacterium]
MKTVITFGTYDLFHIGHVRILTRARAYGDRLVVGVSTDTLNISKKNYKPVFAQEHRLEIVKALSCVDDAFYEESLELKGEYIKKHKADILVMGDDWKGRFDEFKSLCEVVYLPRTEGISTTQVKEDVIQKALR